MPSSSPLKALAGLVKTLRGENGCPWDKKQTPQTLARYLVEEVHELAETVSDGDPEAICEELGDVLFLVFFLTRLYEETGQFDMEAVARRNIAKMIRRHPHVFGDSSASTSADIRAQWHRIKKQEKKNKPPGSALDSIPAGLPALMRAYRVSERAAATGFDWDNLGEVWAKVEEEMGELKDALLKAGKPDRAGRLDDAAVAAAGKKEIDAVMLEFGDVIFTLANVARFSRFHPETASAAATRKFQRRFQWMEQAARDRGQNFEDCDRLEMDRLWDAAKAAERKTGGLLDNT